MRHSFTRGLIAVAAIGLLSMACATSKENASARGEFREGGGSGLIATKPAPGLETVYFDYDRAEIRTDARPALRQNASVIGKKDWDHVVIEGHCDERGSEEYNLALGERRAVSVRGYLKSLGVIEGNITTVSYGESRPAKPGHEESAWQYNRRVEFGLPK